jgi:hypothetical protein
VLHTVVLGVAVGMWDEGRAGLVGMTITMVFHQLFEGVGLGVCIRQAGPMMLWWRQALMVVGCVWVVLCPCLMCLTSGDWCEEETRIGDIGLFAWGDWLAQPQVEACAALLGGGARAPHPAAAGKSLLGDGA